MFWRHPVGDVYRWISEENGSLVTGNPSKTTFMSVGGIGEILFFFSPLGEKTARFSEAFVDMFHVWRCKCLWSTWGVTKTLVIQLTIPPPALYYELWGLFHEQLEQWKKGPWLLRVYVRNETSYPSRIGIIINHEIRIPSKNPPGFQVCWRFPQVMPSGCEPPPRMTK